MCLPRANFEIFGNKISLRNSLIKCIDEINGWFVSQNTKFPQPVPIYMIKHICRKMFQFYDAFSWYVYLGPILRYLATEKSKEIPNCNAWFFFSIFYLKTLIFWQQFPFIWLNMYLEKCFNYFKVQLCRCVYLGPILRHLAIKIARTFPIKMHGRNLWSFCTSKDIIFSFNGSH